MTQPLLKKSFLFLSLACTPLVCAQTLPNQSGPPPIAQPFTKPVVVDESKGIRDMLASVTEAALRKDGLDDLVERLAEPDRARMNASTGTRASKELDAVVEQIRRDWKARYREDFSIDEDLVFGDQFLGMQLVQAQSPPPVLLSNVPTQNVVTPDGSAPVTPASTVSSTPAKHPGFARLTPPTDFAVVVFPITPALPELTVSLSHELPDHWRIDVPDSMNPERLRGNLLRQLQLLAQSKAQWPADVNDAYRMATHHVMAALHGAEPRITK